MKYLYLDIDKNCKSCNGSGLSNWIGNDCPKCLKEIDLYNMHSFQLEELKKAINNTLKKKGIING